MPSEVIFGGTRLQLDLLGLIRKICTVYRKFLLSLHTVHNIVL